MTQTGFGSVSCICERAQWNITLLTILNLDLCVYDCVTIAYLCYCETTPEISQISFPLLLEFSYCSDEELTISH